MRRFIFPAFVALLLCAADRAADKPEDRALHPSWLEQIRGYRVPEWFANANRVQAHTRLSAVTLSATRSTNAPFSAKWLGTPVFRDASKHFKAMGFDVLTRHIATGDEPAWWPSDVGAVLPQAKERNIAEEIIEQAHAQGMRIIAYYRHMEDAGMAGEHPEWICLDSGGNAYASARGLKMCFNTPYRDFVEKRLLELTDMGADGFYFDEIHQPDICTCPACKENGKGREQIIREMFLQYRQAIHTRNPNAVLLASARFEGLSHDLWRLPDTCKIEPHLIQKYGGKDHIEYALGLTFIRDAADGKPSHLWWNPKEQSSLLDCAWILAFGHIFNFDVPEEEISDPKSGHYRSAQEYTSFGGTLTRYLKGTVALRHALVHYPEGKPQGRSGEGIVLSAFRYLSALHVSTGTIIDSQLREGIPPECGLLVIPNTRKARLDDPQVARHIEAFQQRGGCLVTGPMNTANQKVISEWWKKAPLYASGTSADLLVTAYRDAMDDRWTVLLFNPTQEQVHAKVILSWSRKPLKVMDIMANKELEVTVSQEGASVQMPPFTMLSALSVNWEKATVEQSNAPDKEQLRRSLSDTDRLTSRSAKGATQ